MDGVELTTAATPDAARAVAARVIENVAQVVNVDPETLELAMIALLSGGHVLLEDVPGVGKTLLAKAFARSLDCRFARLQFTPDVLPSDVTGVSVFDRRSAAFEFRPGPVFANVLLVDEINRASPKTQSALLESMQENQVTIDGVAHELPLPFFVIATQNPIEHEGTFPLPLAQLDRFALLLRLGYPDPDDEAAMLERQTGGPRPPLDQLAAVATIEEASAAIAAAREVHVDPAVHRYVVELLTATRADARVRLGASPRAGIALVRMAKARALLAGRSFATPDDVKQLALPALRHRLLVDSSSRAEGASAERIVRDALALVPVPT